MCSLRQTYWSHHNVATNGLYSEKFAVHLAVVYHLIKSIVMTLWMSVLQICEYGSPGIKAQMQFVMKMLLMLLRLMMLQPIMKGWTN